MPVQVEIIDLREWASQHKNVNTQSARIPGICPSTCDTRIRVYTYYYGPRIEDACVHVHFIIIIVICIVRFMEIRLPNRVDRMPIKWIHKARAQKNKS